MISLARLLSQQAFRRYSYGGSSLLVSLRGAAAMLTGLSTALTLLLGTTAIGAIGLTGVLMREAASKKALSEILGDFTDTAKQMGTKYRHLRK